MKIFDCFTFFNELDLLEFRLQLLDSQIDFFVIAESNLTHSGMAKPYNFELNKERYSRWLHKIIYLPIQQSAAGLVFDPEQQQHNPSNGSWQLETSQRASLSLAAEKISADDIVIVGDLDEIPDPAIFKNIRPGQLPLSISMLFHNYYMNYQYKKKERWWNGSVVCTGKQFKENSPQLFRDNRNNYKRIKKGGWHFSYLGGYEKIRHKLLSFAHTEYNKPAYTDEKHIIAALEKGEDVLKRPDVKYIVARLETYPVYLQELMKQYPHFIKQAPPKKSFFSFFR